MPGLCIVGGIELKRHSIAIITLLAVTQAFAQETLTPEPEDGVYNFVSHYRVEIAAPPAAVWPVLLDLGGWMYDFEMAPVSGEAGQPGQVLRLYRDQPFMVQITQVVEHKLLAIANLPLVFQGEYGTGVGVMTLHQTLEGTEVALTMSRRYVWQGEGVNPLRTQRATAEFQQQTRALWQDRFLARLKEIVEEAS